MGKLRATRVPIDLPVMVEVGAHVREFRASNVSLGGMFIAGTTLEPNTPVSLMFSAPPYLPRLHVACTARWSTEEGTGVRFDDLASESIDRLAELIRAVLAKMR